MPRIYLRSFVDPVTFETISKQTAVILSLALPFFYKGGEVVAEKSKDMLLKKGNMLLENGIEKIGSEAIDRAKSLLDKISPKMGESLEKALNNVSKNSNDPKAKEELQQEILKLLMENPDLAKEIEITINLNVENIDQLAVGNYNTFFNFGIPSGDKYIKIIEYLDQKRKETRNQEILSHYNPSTLPYYPEKLKKFVTENRAGELRKTLSYIEEHRILLLSGVGGVGKSTLARALIDLRPVNVPEPFWLSFYENQGAKLGDILEKLASYMNAPEIASFKTEKREPEKTDVDKLTDELHRSSEIWLIFDDLSTAIEDTKFSDKGIELLFSSLRYNTHNAKIIITSRILPILENGESLLDAIEDEEKQHLKGLKPNFAVNYLAKNGLEEVKPEKLEELATSVDGHPLALKLLVELVKEFGVVCILEDLSIYQEQKEDTIKKARRLFEKLAGNEKELIEHISVYREPVNMKGLKVMFTGNTPINAVKKLLDKSLLETDHRGSYWLHPLIQEFSYKDLKNMKEAHINACKYYIFLPLPQKLSKKEDVQSIIEAHYHACNAGKFELAARILYHSNLCGQLHFWGNFRDVVELCTPLLPCISLEGRIISLEFHGHFLGILGIACLQLGLAEEAIVVLEEALKIARLREDKKGEGNQLGNLGLTYYQLGDYRKSIEYYEQALKVAKEIGDRSGESASYENLGNSYFILGEIKQAIINYTNTSKIMEEDGVNKDLAGHLGNLGILHIQIGEVDKGVYFLEKSLKIYKELGDKIGERNQQMNMGIAYRNLRELEKSKECYKKALKISAELEDESGEGGLLMNIGNLCLNCGQAEEAIEFYQKSLKIDRRSRNRRGESLSLASLGISYASIGQFETAIEFYEESLNIAKKIEDTRTECIALLNMGYICFDLGQVERALSHFNEALFIGKKIKDPMIIEKCETALNSKNDRSYY